MPFYLKRLPGKAIDDIGLQICIWGFMTPSSSYDNLLEKCYVIGVDFGLDSTLEDRMKQAVEVSCRKSDSEFISVDHKPNPKITGNHIMI